MKRIVKQSAERSTDTAGAQFYHFSTDFIVITAKGIRQVFDSFGDIAFSDGSKIECQCVRTGGESNISYLIS